MKIALLGTGLMGAPMVRCLLAAGHTVHVWNRSATKAEALVTDGAVFFSEPAQAVKGVTHVITMLSDGQAVADTLFENGVAAAMNAGSTVIDMSSIKPSQARDHAARLRTMGLGHLDAPVSGGTKAATEGTMAIMVGGNETIFENALDAFAPMGRATRVGEDGAGQLSKLANQAIVAITIGAVAEATLLMRQGGADLTAFRQALSGGFADSIILQQHGKRMDDGNFEPGGRSVLQLKDLNNLLEEAQSLGLELPSAKAVRDRFNRFVHELDGAERDHSGLFCELEERNELNRDN